MKQENIMNGDEYVMLDPNITQEKALTILEAAMATFAKSDHEDPVAFKLAVAALADAPLYFSVEIDLAAMLGTLGPAKLKPGDILQPQKDVRARFLTLNLGDGTEFVPMFTSTEEVNKGVATSVIRFSLRDYLPQLVNMNRHAIINPFSENRFILTTQVITELLIPLAANKENEQPEVKDKPAVRFERKIVADRYTILNELRCDGNYTTYLAMEMRVNKVWAIKVCDKKDRNYDPRAREALITESNIMKRLNHPAIPKVRDLVEDDDGVYFVREYVEGENLENLVGIFGAQPEEKVINWIIQICEVLAYLHSQTPPYIYRDMKPANVILQPCGVIKLVDFGTVEVSDKSIKADECVLGTVGYAAPEGYHGCMDPRSDIFSIGMTMYRLVTGVNPVEAYYNIKPARQIDPKISVEVERIIEKCTKSAPKERYQSCEELREAVSHIGNLPGNQPSPFIKRLVSLFRHSAHRNDASLRKKR